MDSQTVQLLVTVLVGLLVGAFITWLAARRVHASALEAAVLKSQAEAQAELSQLRERSRTFESSAQKGQASFYELNVNYERRREELDKVRDEVSRLSERASRVESLEASLIESREQLRRQAEELRQVSAEASEKATLAQSNALHASTLEKNLDETMNQLKLTTADVKSLTGQKASLEEQASRVKPLEDERDAARQQLDNLRAELRRVSSEAAEKSTLAQSNAQRADSLEKAMGELRGQLVQAASDLQSLTGHKATLEEQASRVKPLEDELETVRQQLSRFTEDLRRVSSEASEKAMLAQSNEKRADSLELALAEVRNQFVQVTADAKELTGQKATLEEQVTRIPVLEDELLQVKQARAEADATVTKLAAEVSKLNTQLQAELKSSQEKLSLLEDAKNTLSQQFKNVANDILEEKSKKFAEQNQANLGQLLDPLRQQIHEFKGKVEEVYVQEGKDRSAMAEQVRQLVTLNQALSQEAKNLTNALKGNTKAQGNWGELILERVLEASGLRKGEEYIVQDSQTREDGSRAQPDVVILLPEQRKLVVDSKVSLNAYEEYTVAESDEDRQLAARRHLDSIRKHVFGLSSKSYEKLYGNGLDFVLMFVPIEPAFMLAISNDDRLFMDAWERNVLLVSPSTLLFVVRTVAHLWRQEQQSRNAQDIAKRGAELYDKLVDFVKDLELVGTRLKQAKDSYEDAHKRLATGKGNVIRQAEMLRELGVKATKKFSTELVGVAQDELPPAPPLTQISSDDEC